MRLRRIFSDRNLTIITFLVLPLIVYTVLVALPILQSFRFSLFEWDGLGPLENYIGFGNYSEMLHDSVFWQSLKNNLFLVVFSLITQLPPAIILAVLLTGKLRGREFFRTTFFSPQILSAVATGYMFYYVFEPTFGLLNGFLRSIGLDALAKGWLGDLTWALPVILFVISWRHIGFYMVLFMAAIEGIPSEILEAARIDGCGSGRLVWHITVPMISGAIRTAAVLAIVGSIKYFDLIWIMTKGGPVHATELVATYMYKQTFNMGHLGYGATLAFTLFVVAFILSLILNWLTSPSARAALAEKRSRRAS
jgi:raffinose/stachyose/melibiose transport system permease protein